MSDRDRAQGCEEFGQAVAELALGVLPGYERATALAHLDRCPACRTAVSRLAETRDRLLAAVPEAEPPAGFERRALAGLGRRRRPVRGRTVVAAAVLAVALVAAGWLLGRAGAPAGEAPGAAATAVAGGELAAAELTADGRRVGWAYAHPGPGSFVYVALYPRGLPPGPVSCSLHRPDGSALELGTFTVSPDYAAWGVPAPLESAELRGSEMVLYDAAGRPVASGWFDG